MQHNKEMMIDLVCIALGVLTIFLGLTVIRTEYLHTVLMVLGGILLGCGLA